MIVMSKKDVIFVPIGFFIIFMSILSYPYVVYDTVTLAVLAVAFIAGVITLAIGVKLYLKAGKGK